MKHMNIPAEMHSPTDKAERGAEREHIDMRVGFRKRGYETTKVNVLDISQTGFKAEVTMPLAKGSEVWLKLPGIEARVAEVVWVDNFFVGCKFEQPFYEPVFDDMMRRLKNP